MNDLSESNFTPYAVCSYDADSPPVVSAEDLEHDRRMDERIEGLRKKRLRREKLTDDEWKLIAFGSQACHCGQRTV
jgi:hypothetical protein